MKIGRKRRQAGEAEEPKNGFVSWREIFHQEEEYLKDPKNLQVFSFEDHPEFPSLGKMPPEEVYELLVEYITAEGKIPSLSTMIGYAPIVEYTVNRQNGPIL